MSVIDALARLSPRTTAPESLRKEAMFLDSDPVRVATVADGVGILVVGGMVALALVVGRPVLLVVAAGVGYGTTALIRGGALVVANVRRSRALGAAPTVVSRAVLRVRIAPTAEGAAAFAAQTDGILGDHLAEHVRRARGTPRSGLGSFATVWREASPSLHRALTLVEASVAAPDGERERTLDRAMDAILRGTQHRASEAADSLRGPATAVYAFGVLLPLALAGVLPAAGAAGIEATLAAVVITYDLLLPAGLLCASGWLLSKRPVAFPPARVGSDLAPDRRWPPIAAGSITASVCVVAASVILPSWTIPLAAVGLGVGIASFVRYRPLVAIRRRADGLDAALSDALYLVGRRVADGTSVERAIADVSDELDGVAGETFRAVARRQQHLRVDVETAFNGEYGALEGVPSQRAESAARLLDLAARAGPPAGRALIETADNLDALARVEQDARRDLGNVTSTLDNTAAFFGPLIGGATVALADSIGTTGTLDGNVPGTADLGLAVGVYVLLLAAILTALATGLSRGFDRATVGYRVGVALCTATVTYFLSFATAAAVAGGL